MVRAVFLLLCASLADGALRGVVTDASTAEPVPQVRIALLPSGVFGEVIGEAMSDAQGRYLISTAAKGDFRVFASKDGYHDMRLLRVMNTLGP